MLLPHPLPSALANQSPTTSVIAEGVGTSLPAGSHIVDNCGQIRSHSPSVPLVCFHVGLRKIKLFNVAPALSSSSALEHQEGCSVWALWHKSLDRFNRFHQCLGPRAVGTQIVSPCQTLVGGLGRSRQSCLWKLPFWISFTLLHPVHQTPDLGHTLIDRIQIGLRGT